MSVAIVLGGPGQVGGPGRPRCYDLGAATWARPIGY